jgi:hypothetical protein
MLENEVFWKAALSVYSLEILTEVIDSETVENVSISNNPF